MMNLIAVTDLSRKEVHNAEICVEGSAPANLTNEAYVVLGKIQTNSSKAAQVAAFKLLAALLLHGLTPEQEVVAGKVLNFRRVAPR